MFPLRPIAPRPAASSVLAEKSIDSINYIRKQQRNRHTTDDWEVKKATILRLYLEEKRNAEDVLRILARDGFKTSRRLFFAKLRQWGVKKNQKQRETLSGSMSYPGVPRSPSTYYSSPAAEPSSVEAPFTPPSFQLPKYYLHPDVASTTDSINIMEFQLDMPDPRPPRASPSRDVAPWLAQSHPNDIPLRTSTPPPAPVVPWTESLPWTRFQSNWCLPAFNAITRLFRCSDCAPMMKFVRSPALFFEPLSWGTSLPPKIEYADVYQTLTCLMPERFEYEHQARAQAITNKLGDALSITSVLEFLFFFASNNLCIKNSSEKMDEALLDVVEYLLRIKAPLNIFASAEPTAQALAGRIFAAAIHLSHIKLLKRLSKRGFEIRSWVRRRIPCSDLSHLRYSGLTPRGGLGSILPIHLSLYQSNVELTKFLLEHGANINDHTNVSYSHSFSSIHAAAASNRTRGDLKPKSEIINLVLQHPDIIVTENQLLDALSLLNYRIPDRDNVTVLLFDHIRRLRHSKGFVSPTRVLMYAIRYSQQDIIDATIPQLDAKSDPSEPDNTFWNEDSTPLWEAACQGNYALCELLLDSGMSQDPEDPSSPSALHVAAHYGHVNILQLFIARGAQIHSRLPRPKFYQVGPHDFIGLEGTALSCAIVNDQDQSAKFLLEAGSKCDMNDLMLVIKYANHNIFNGLIDSGLNILDETTHGGSTLSLAIKSENESLAAYILDLYPTKYDPTALLEAVCLSLRTKSTSLVTRLLARRVEYASYDDQNTLPEGIALAMSVYYGDLAMTSLLMENGLFLCSDLNHHIHYNGYLPSFSISSTWIQSLYLEDTYIIRNGCSLIGVATLGQEQEMVDFLLGHGYQACAEDLYCAVYAHDESAAMNLLQDSSFFAETFHYWPSWLPMAIEGDMTHLADFLLEQQIYVDDFSARIRRYDQLVPSKTALQAASAKGDMTRIRSLIDLGANVNAKASERRGATALQYSVMNGFIGAVKLLIEKGADCNAPGATFNGRTALEAAGEHGHLDIIQHLLTTGAKIVGDGQLQYLRAVRFAEAEGHFAAAEFLKSHRVWTPEDQSLFADIQLQEIWDIAAEYFSDED